MHELERHHLNSSNNPDDGWTTSPTPPRSNNGTSGLSRFHLTLWLPVWTCGTLYIITNITLLCLSPGGACAGCNAGPVTSAWHYAFSHLFGADNERPIPSSLLSASSLNWGDEQQSGEPGWHITESVSFQMPILIFARGTKQMDSGGIWQTGDLWSFHASF